MAEECVKYDELDEMLSGGLCGIDGSSECGSGNFSLVPLALVSRSCVVVSTPCVGPLVDGSPRRGLTKAVCGDVRRFTVPSEGNKDNDDSVGARMPLTSPERRLEVEPVA